MKRILLLAVMTACLFATSASRADDPVKVDPKHYKVEFENDTVRVLRIHYGPGEKSVMHDHPEGVAIFLTDEESKMTLPDGTTRVDKNKAGTVLMGAGGAHLPENIGSKPMELILVELKTKPAAK